jgi:hypothetical protein
MSYFRLSGDTSPGGVQRQFISIQDEINAKERRLAVLEGAVPAAGVLPDNVERWVKYTTAFDTPSLVSHVSGVAMVEVASIPADSVATGLRFVVPTFFTGGPITNVEVNLSTLIVGGSFLTSSFTSGSSSFTIYSATAPENLARNGLIVAGSAPTPVEFEFVFYGGSGADLVAGQLETYVRLSIPQSTGTTLQTA